MKSEQPLRVLAVLVVGPYLIYTGKKHKDNTLIVLGVLFMIIEIYCLLFIKPKKF